MYTVKNEDKDLKSGHERFDDEETQEQIRESDFRKKRRKRSKEQNNAWKNT